MRIGIAGAAGYTAGELITIDPDTDRPPRSRTQIYSE